MRMDGGPLAAVVGPTASGKSEAALRIAEALDAEIISIDSMTVYRGMDIGTAKPSLHERARVAHHLIDVAGPDESFSVARYQALARNAVRDIRQRGSIPLLVGGTGLYFRAVVDDLEFPGTDPALRAGLETEALEAGPEQLYARLAASDPRAAAKIEPANVRRTVRALEVATLYGRPFSSFSQAWDAYPPERVRAAGIAIDPALLARRIKARVRRQFDEGLVGEVRALLEGGAGPSLTARQAIRYAEVIDHLDGLMSLDEAILRTVKRTRALARRQVAWFRRDPRIRWFEAGEEGAPASADALTEYLRDG